MELKPSEDSTRVRPLVEILQALQAFSCTHRPKANHHPHLKCVQCKNRSLVMCKDDNSYYYFRCPTCKQSINAYQACIMEFYQTHLSKTKIENSFFQKIDSLVPVPEDPTVELLAQSLSEKGRAGWNKQNVWSSDTNLAVFPKQTIEEYQLHRPLFCPSVVHQERTMEFKQLCDTEELARFCDLCTNWILESHVLFALQYQYHNIPYIIMYFKPDADGNLVQFIPTGKKVDWNKVKMQLLPLAQINTNIQINHGNTTNNVFIQNNNDAEVKALRERVQLLEQTQKQQATAELKEIIETAFEKERKRKFLEEEQEEQEDSQKISRQETKSCCNENLQTTSNPSQTTYHATG